ncbi:MAG TPA: cation:proton antiporter [Nanoarchaeota archaeon]|nr:cation:proton antiporter [Nanoarchaeota archaeon]
MELAILLAIIYLFTFFVGHFLEKIKVPWIFSALIFGFIISITQEFQELVTSETFSFLALLGMHFLLFMIGFEIDLNELLKNVKFYGKATAFIIFIEGIIGCFLLHFLFSLPILPAFIVALSFATVGEAVLIPILEETNLLKKPLGKVIIGIGILDDAFEVLTLVLASFLVGTSFSKPEIEIIAIIFGLSMLFLLTYLFSYLKEEGRKFKHPKIETLFVFVFFVFFVFLSLGSFADASPLGAILAGVGLRTFLPEKRLELIESEIKTMSYGFFAPIFFVWVGSTTEFSYIINYASYIGIIVILTGIGKIIASYISAKKELGKKNALILGIGLCTRFSTSLVIIKYLYEANIISQQLYSVLVASTTIFTIFTPLIFSFLVKKFYS